MSSTHMNLIIHVSHCMYIVYAPHCKLWLPSPEPSHILSVRSASDPYCAVSLQTAGRSTTEHLYDALHCLHRNQTDVLSYVWQGWQSS